MNFNIDHNRHARLGFPEVVYGATKDTETLLKIIESIYSKSKKVLITKLQSEKYQKIKLKYPQSFYDEKSCICLVGKIRKSRKTKPEVIILSGGTSDEFIVNEIYYTLHFLGINVKKMIDVGVAGMHRLTEKIEEINIAKVLVVCAGFEGALPTVVGGLFSQPIIAVPISVGYGVAEGGRAALNSMLSSCANGITVTNIDNGYGAAIAAFRIINN